MSIKHYLLISAFPPKPITSGGRMRLSQTIKSLASRTSSLTVFSLYHTLQEQKLNKQSFNQMKINSQFFHDRKKQYFSYFRNGQPYWFSDSFNQELINKLTEVAKDYQQVQIDFSQLLYLVKYLPRESKKIFVAYDVSSLSFWRRLINEKNYLKKILHFFRFLEIYFYERRYLPQFDLVIAMSDIDRQSLIKCFHLKNVSVIPNGIEELNFIPKRKADGHINLGYIGSVNHPPNLQALQYIFKEILPILRENQIKYRFYLAGDNSNFDQYCDPNFINLGVIDEVEDFYKKIDCLLAPIFAGSGTRIKILESLSFGKPVISSQLASEGLKIDSLFLKIISQKQSNNPAIWLKAIQENKTTQWQKRDYSSLESALSQLTWQKLLKQIPLID